MGHYDLWSGGWRTAAVSFFRDGQAGLSDGIYSEHGYFCDGGLAGLHLRQIIHLYVHNRLRPCRMAWQDPQLAPNPLDRSSTVVYFHDAGNHLESAGRPAAKGSLDPLCAAGEHDRHSADPAYRIYLEGKSEAT
ncbi:hypothetical protein D3C73_1372060 [compost metagenome]